METPQKRPHLSIVIPAYNEGPQIQTTIKSVISAFAEKSLDWELIIVNDGSTDQTLSQAQQSASKDTRVRIVSYPINTGRGKALREGLKHARGNIIVTADADLSYDCPQIYALYNHLGANPHTDIVLGSAYMPGGQTVNVPWQRLLVSRTGNMIISKMLPKKFYTITCVFRAYRRHVIQSLDLISDGKDIHLEILSKCLALGFHIDEIPACLNFRKKGVSKFQFRATAFSHMIFSISEKPSLFFGIIGLIFIMLGVGAGIYLIFLWQMGQLTPNRPLIILMALLILSGIQMLSFGFIGTQIVFLKNELVRLRKNQNEIKSDLENRPE